MARDGLRFEDEQADVLNFAIADEKNGPGLNLSIS